jgi:hypothetical protein
MTTTVERCCIIGVQSCGCITYANSRPDCLDRDDEKTIARIISSGGYIERLTVEAARCREHFLPNQCPHLPRGWEREEPKEPAPIRMKRTYRRGVWQVLLRHPRWPTGTRIGEVGKQYAGWFATVGWLHEDGSAHDGDSPNGPAEIFGPFRTRREASEALIPLGRARLDELVKSWLL